MDVKGEDAVAMMGQAGELQLQGARWKRTRLLLACCVSCCFLLAALSVYLLLQHVAPKGETQTDSEMLRQPFDTADKPRAHLTAKETLPDKIDGQYFALQWEDKNGLAFTKGSLNYQNRALTIPRKGDYFVYSQVSFRGTRSNKLKNITHITHIITKLTSSYPDPTQLLSSTRSINGDPWHVAIYLGAVFHLEQGDRIVVNVSSVNQVDFTNDHKTYFGAFLL
ncbi:tumor necrosis factor ligand superfamily member 15-like [Carcharodon carcharias]|uniref:tumor necrosis factor ligand superfamily member 15 n=1 Tax=Carcharodon carcharias TaxID=13397 RepID=UPI001B7E81FD|nr:tumor necrosis factor ligand superfamily member 15 [Carcharodon carcharias]